MMELSDFSNLDYFVIVVVLISSYFGCKKGFIESFIDFFAWVGSALIVADNYTLIFDLLNEHIANKFLCGFVASIGIYVILVILISLLGIRILKFSSKFVGGTIDKFMGGIFGAVRGILVALAIFWSLYMTIYAINDQKLPEWMTQAQLYKPLKMGSDLMVDIITSEEEREDLMKMIEKKSSKLENDVAKDIQKNNKKVQESIEDGEFMDE